MFLSLFQTLLKYSESIMLIFATHKTGSFWIFIYFSNNAVQLFKNLPQSNYLCASTYLISVVSVLDLNSVDQSLNLDDNFRFSFLICTVCLSTTMNTKMAWLNSIEYSLHKGQYHGTADLLFYCINIQVNLLLIQVADLKQGKQEFSCTVVLPLTK